jgi:hypothetical protein
VRVAGDKHRPVTLLAVIQSELGAGGGFSRALKSGQNDDIKPVAMEPEGLRGTAHKCGQLIKNYFNELLAGRDAGKHLAAHGLCLDVGGEFFDNAIIDVGLQ